MVLSLNPYQDSADPEPGERRRRGIGDNLMRIGSIFLAATIALVVAGPAGAAIVGDASVPYSATRTVIIDRKTYLDKVFHVPGMEREDVAINGVAMEFILNLDRGHGAAVLPGLGSYLEFPLPPLMGELDRGRLAGKEAGEDRIDGIRATRYRIDFTATDGVKGEGALWLSRDNILLRIEGRIVRPGHRPTRVSMTLTDLRLAPQDRSLFIIPNGLHKIPMEALEILLNLRLHKHH
jgi:hypothetical protein